MIKIKEYNFIILLVSLLLIYGVLFLTITQMSLASILALTSSILVFAIYFFNKEENKKAFKIINLIVQNIFIIFLALFVLIALYASPDNEIYLKESSIFLLSFSISLASIFLYANINIYFLVLYFIIAAFFIISFSLVYSFSSPTGIKDIFSSIIGFSGLVVLMGTIYYKNIINRVKGLGVEL